MLKGHELAWGDHTQYPVRVSQALRNWFDDGSNVLLWSYQGGSFDPHPGYVALLSTIDEGAEVLYKLRGVLAGVLRLRRYDLCNGDLVGGCTVCFTPSMGSRGAILVIEGDYDMVTAKGMTEILENVDAEMGNL